MEEEESSHRVITGSVSLTLKELSRCPFDFSHPNGYESLCLHFKVN